jgi:hypothetical protein
MSGGQEAGAYARAEWAANLLLSLLGEQEQVGVMVNEYLQIYKKRRGEEEGVFVFARDYRRGYWAEAPLAPSELATLLALLLAPPQKWRERLAGERYATLVVNGYVRVERGEGDGALRVVVSDYRKNYNATAVYLASDRERFIKFLQKVERVKELEREIIRLRVRVAELKEENKRLRESLWVLTHLLYGGMASSPRSPSVPPSTEDSRVAAPQAVSLSLRS